MPPGSSRSSSIGNVFRGMWGLTKRYKWQIVRGSALGTAIGIQPGAGADIASWITYAMSKRFSKEPEKFGTGHVEGIVESGAANNSALAGAWMPALVFGIPGDSITAIAIGVLYLKNLNPGPTLFINNPQNVYAIFLVFVLANLIMLPLGWLAIKIAKRVLRVPRDLLMPVILLFCVVGAFAINNTVFGVLLILVFGLARLRAGGKRLPHRAGDPRRGARRHAGGEPDHLDDQVRRRSVGLLHAADRRRPGRRDLRDPGLAADRAAVAAPADMRRLRCTPFVRRPR